MLKRYTQHLTLYVRVTYVLPHTHNPVCDLLASNSNILPRVVWKVVMTDSKTRTDRDDWSHCTYFLTSCLQDIRMLSKQRKRIIGFKRFTALFQLQFCKLFWIARVSKSALLCRKLLESRSNPTTSNCSKGHLAAICAHRNVCFCS